MNKQNEVAARLEALIRERNLKPGDRVPSEYELAELCGVNKTTANKAVAQLVARGRLERRRGAAGTVLRRAPGMVRGVIAFRTAIVSGVTYLALVMRGASRCAAENGYVLQYHEIELREESHQLENILASGACGLLYSLNLAVPEDFPLPTLSVGMVGEWPGNFVHSDREAGARAMAEKLLDYGHRKLLVLAQTYDASFVSAVRGVFAARGIAFPEERCLVFDEHSFDVERFCAETLPKFPGVTAIACDSDGKALQLIELLQRRGIRVPEDISVTGYAAMGAYQALRRMDTVDQFPEKIGYLGCKGLIDLIEGRSTEIRRLVTPEVVSGDTLRRIVQ